MPRPPRGPVDSAAPAAPATQSVDDPDLQGEGDRYLRNRARGSTSFELKDRPPAAGLGLRAIQKEIALAERARPSGKWLLVSALTMGAGAVLLLGSLFDRINYGSFGARTTWKPLTPIITGLLVGGLVAAGVGLALMVAVLVLRYPYNVRIEELEEASCCRIFVPEHASLRPNRAPTMPSLSAEFVLARF